VGKTTVSVNLAVALQAQGERVMLLDADLGLANAQIALGTPCPSNLSHFLAGQKSLAEIIVTTRSGVKLVPGASGMQEMAGINPLQAASIVQAFSGLEDDVDHLIVDMAAGIAPSVMSLMMTFSALASTLPMSPSTLRSRGRAAAKLGARWNWARASAARSAVRSVPSGPGR
jgi:MinD-like ATPase involved in chromosome partitioning or flagellar assembly